MLRKVFLQVLVLISILLATLAVSGNAQAGGYCGSTYVVQWGDTLDEVAAICGTTVSALYAANPGISGYLYAGQVLVIPSDNYCNCPSGYYYDCNCPPGNYTGTYIVQYGDTFSMIASRYGISAYELWALNPQIWNINYVYAGQVLYVPAGAGQPVYYPQTTGQVVYPPASPWFAIVPTPAEELVPLSYGTVPEGTPYGKIKLSNMAYDQIYVSLQGTTRDGSHVINEYPVDGKMSVRVPAGWYVYVAWVGGHKFKGQFNLSGGGDRTLTFYSDKVVVE